MFLLDVILARNIGEATERQERSSPHHPVSNGVHAVHLSTTQTHEEKSRTENQKDDAEGQAHDGFLEKQSNNLFPLSTGHFYMPHLTP